MRIPTQHELRRTVTQRESGVCSVKPAVTHALRCFSNLLEFFKVLGVFLINKVHHCLTLEGGELSGVRYVLAVHKYV